MIRFSYDPPSELGIQRFKPTLGLSILQEFVGGVPCRLIEGIKLLPSVESQLD